MENLEKIQEDFDEDQVNYGYRLWLTSVPNNQFSVNILQSGIKIVLEPPIGIKSKLNLIFDNISEEDFTAKKKNETY